MGAVIPTANRDEPLIGFEAIHRVALRANRRRTPTEIRRVRIPYPSGTVPRSTDDAARLWVEMSGPDKTLGTFESRNRHSGCDIGDDGRAICARGEHEI